MAKLPRVMPGKKTDPVLTEHEEPLMEHFEPKAKKKPKASGTPIAPAEEKKTKPSGGTDMVAP